MSRAEFTKPTKRQALKRSCGHCEATGALYGLRPGQRCNAPLSFGVQFDHIDPDANSKDNSLDNCCACCPRCHRWKTSNMDQPRIAKTVRQADKQNGIKRRKGPPMAGARDSRFKRRMDGTVVSR